MSLINLWVESVISSAPSDAALPGLCDVRPGYLRVMLAVFSARGDVDTDALVDAAAIEDREEAAAADATNAAADTLVDAAVDAARLRFRPILMTSMAFSLGVLPLVLSTGAGSGGRTAIGSGVLSGTITATVLGVLFVPLFFALIARLGPKKKGG